MLSNADVTFVCTRRGDLGAAAHKAFGLFFLISMQNAVLRRPGIENSRIPHFLYIDEFADFICKDTEAMFTLYRKYKVGTIISTQSLQQLETPELAVNYKSTILSNCANKIFTGNGDYDELEWWSNDFGNTDNGNIQTVWIWPKVNMIVNMVMLNGHLHNTSNLENFKI